MKRWIVVLVNLIVISSFAQHQEVEWMDFEQLDKAWEDQPKKVLLFFHEEGCVYCRKMEITAFRNPEIVSTLNNDFYAVSMDAHTTDTIRLNGHPYINPDAGKTRFPIHDLAAHFIMRDGYPVSFPVTVLLDENFQVAKRSFEYISPKAMKEFIQ